MLGAGCWVLPAAPVLLCALPPCPGAAAGAARDSPTLARRAPRCAVARPVAAAAHVQITTLSAAPLPQPASACCLSVALLRRQPYLTLRHLTTYIHTRLPASPASHHVSPAHALEGCSLRAAASASRRSFVAPGSWAEQARPRPQTPAEQRQELPSLDHT